MLRTIVYAIETIGSLPGEALVQVGRLLDFAVTGNTGVSGYPRSLPACLQPEKPATKGEGRKLSPDTRDRAFGMLPEPTHFTGYTKDGKKICGYNARDGNVEYDAETLRRIANRGR